MSLLHTEDIGLVYISAGSKRKITSQMSEFNFMGWMEQGGWNYCKKCESDDITDLEEVYDYDIVKKIN